MTDIRVSISQSPVIRVSLSQSPVIRVALAGVGSTGPPGPAGGSSVTMTAGETLSTGRLVILDAGTVKYFQPSNPLHAGRAYGVTLTSATIGNSVNVQLSGELTDAAFSFATDSRLWAGANGRIYDTIQAGIIQKAGVSSGANKMKIDFSIQIVTI